MLPLSFESSHSAHLADSVSNALQYSARAIRQVAGGRDGLTPLGWAGLIVGFVIGKAIVLLFCLGLLVRAAGAVRDSLTGAIGKSRQERRVGRHLAEEVPIRHARRARRPGRGA